MRSGLFVRVTFGVHHTRKLTNTHTYTLPKSTPLRLFPDKLRLFLSSSGLCAGMVPGTVVCVGMWVVGEVWPWMGMWHEVVVVDVRVREELHVGCVCVSVCSCVREGDCLRCVLVCDCVYVRVKGARL